MKNLVKILTALLVCGTMTLGLSFDKVEAAQVSGTISTGNVTISVNTDKDSNRNSQTPPNYRHPGEPRYHPGEPRHNPATPNNKTSSKNSPAPTKKPQVNNPKPNDTPNKKPANNHRDDRPNNNSDNHRDNRPNNDNSRTPQRW